MSCYSTVAESIVDISKNLLRNPDYVSKPRNQKINEYINLNIEIRNVKSNIFFNKARSTPKKYLANELLLYFSGESSLEKYALASSFWKKLYPEGYSYAVNSAYGNLLFNKNPAFRATQEHVYGQSQWEWAKNSLLSDKDSRQAIMHYNRPVHQYEGNGDFVCTLSSQFLIRDDKLFLITNMRSQDIHFGYTFDVVFFTLLMQCMRLELINKYPELELGSYFHNVGSFHMYERNFQVYEEMQENQTYEESLPELVENPILNENIINMANGLDYTGNDKFFMWLNKNKG